MSIKFPLTISTFGDEEAMAVKKVISTKNFTMGENVKTFENNFSKYNNRKYGIAVSSGTAALEVAVACIGLQPGDEVILPSFTIISCALAIIRQGGKRVLVDSEPGTWNMDVTQIEEKISSLSIEDRALQREKQIISHTVAQEDVQHIKNLWKNDPRWSGIFRPYSEY